jgi:hypothetical protein
LITLGASVSPGLGLPAVAVAKAGASVSYYSVSSEPRCG